jgi:muramoyltetrapeptide carboxypeptidase
MHPAKLKKGQDVCIVAPAGPPDPAMLERGVRFLSDAGFNVKIGRHVLDRRGYLAGSDDMRIEDFNVALRDPDVRGIFCARGGYGCARIVSKLDFDAVRRDPKIIAGYSDITTFLAAFWSECRLHTFHGPLIGSQKASDWSYRQLLVQITKPELPFVWPVPPDFPPHSVIRTGNAQGRMIGGCLSILCSLSGTPFHPKTDDTIFFTEEVGEAPYRIDRMLFHLKNSGWFASTSGFLFGQFNQCIQRNDDPEPSLTIDEIIHDVLFDTHGPILTGVPFGHGYHNFTIPFGCKCLIDHHQIIQLESGVD